MSGSKGEYVKERLAQIAAVAGPKPKKHVQKKRMSKNRPSKRRRGVSALTQLLRECTGPDGEVYGHRD